MNFIFFFIQISIFFRSWANVTRQWRFCSELTNRSSLTIQYNWRFDELDNFFFLQLSMKIDFFLLWIFFLHLTHIVEKKHACSHYFSSRQVESWSRFSFLIHCWCIFENYTIFFSLRNGTHALEIINQLIDVEHTDFVIATISHENIIPVTPLE